MGEGQTGVPLDPKRRARAQVTQAVGRIQALRAEREKRITAAALEVVGALEARKDKLAELEQAAAAGIAAMLAEGLTIAEILEWTGGTILDAKEAGRLARLASDG